MNRKVFVSMLALCVSFLAGCYFLKIFFPQEFVMAIENQKIISIGNFIDSHKWCYYLCCTITAFITYWFYVCACCEIKCLKVWQSIVIIIAILFSFVLNEINPNIAMYYSFAVMIILPASFKGKLTNVSVVFTIHLLAQYLSLNIRNFPLLLSNINYAIYFLMGIESYLWLALFYIIYNFKKEN